MMHGIRARFELVRIPAVFSAHADIVAGFLIAGGGIREFPSFVALLAATTLLYSAGMALNDVFDADIDRRERPERPIPSGRVSRNEGLVIGMLCLIAGAAVAALAGWVSAVIAVILAAAIIAYNAGFKSHSFFGPAVMGGCRYLNFALGLSLVPHLPALILLPAITGVYIFGVTVLSRDEASGGVISTAVWTSGLTVALTGLLMVLFHQVGLMPRATGPILGMLWAGGIILYLYRLKEDAPPDLIQAAVRFMLMNLIVLDGIIVIGFSPAVFALPVWALLLPGRYLARRFYVT